MAGLVVVMAIHRAELLSLGARCKHLVGLHLSSTVELRDIGIITVVHARNFDVLIFSVFLLY